MSEKRFLLDKVEKGNAILSVKITDSVSDDDYFIMTKDFYEDDIDEIVDLLNEQQVTINNLQELVAELGATLLMNGFEIEINGENLSELMTDE